VQQFPKVRCSQRWGTNTRCSMRLGCSRGRGTTQGGLWGFGCFQRWGSWKTLDGYSAKEIDHAGTYVMFLKSLLSIAEIQVWVPQEEKWWEHFQLSAAFYEPKCIQKLAHLPIYESIIKGLLNLFFPYLVSSLMILMFSSVGIWATPSGSNSQKKKSVMWSLTCIVKLDCKAQQSQTEKFSNW